MTIPTNPIKRRRRVTQSGTHFHLQLDNAAHSRLLHLGHIARQILGVNADLSSTARACIGLAMDTIDAQLRRASSLAEGCEAQERILDELRARFAEGTRSGTVSYPSDAEVLQILADSISNWVTFKELVRKHAKRQREALKINSEGTSNALTA